MNIKFLLEPSVFIFFYKQNHITFYFSNEINFNAFTLIHRHHIFFLYKYRHHILKAIYHWKHYNTQKHASKLTLYSAHILKEFKSVLDSQEKSRRKNAIQSELKNWIIGKKKFLLISQFWSLNFHYLKTKKKRHKDQFRERKKSLLFRRFSEQPNRVLVRVSSRDFKCVPGWIKTRAFHTEWEKERERERVEVSCRGVCRMWKIKSTKRTNTELYSLKKKKTKKKLNDTVLG